MGQCVVLNSAYQPLGTTNEEDAICLILDNRAEALVEDPKKIYRSQYLTLKAPKVIVLKYYIEVKGVRIKKERVTRKGLFRRDNYTCQYCGKYKDQLGKFKGNFPNKLTIDHIIPRNKGGTNLWTNVTTACQKCNLRKGNKTPEEAGMKLLSPPTIPISWYIKGKNRLTEEELDLIEGYLFRHD